MQKSIKYPVYKDKIQGAWVGKCAGGILGAPIEGYKRFNNIELNDKLFENNFANDDLDLQLLWLDMALKKGANIRESDFKEHWANHVAFPWNEYGIATRNIRLGLDNPDSGTHNNDYWKHSMGSPIRSEIWGILCAGNPEKAAFYAKMDSTLDHEGFSVDAEQYLAACMALAFVKDDVHEILIKGLDYVPKKGMCAKLIRSIMYWNREFGAMICLGKIKSLYGDADFTSAPMNVGFTVLSLLNSKGDLDTLSTALHYGHDSDCIVATAGALLGAIVGYASVPETWKVRVGNEILVSPEITGIECPNTITQLTELSCKAAGPFLNLSTTFKVENYPSSTMENEKTIPYHLNTKISSYPIHKADIKGSVRLSIENLNNKPLTLKIQLRSKYFEHQSKEVTIAANKTENFDLVLNPIFDSYADSPSLSYTLEVAGEEHISYLRGVPNYGEWLLLGPFMEDDSALEPMDGTYPDHGMSSLPSVQYMNHDKQRPSTEFVNPKEVIQFLNHSEFEKAPYGAQFIYPNSMKINLGDHFYGKGERTLYMYTHLNCAKKIKKWLSMGHSNYSTVWLNREKIHQTKAIRRRWPGTENVELQLQKGLNEVLIRFDFIHDDYLIHLGLKEHLGKHPHQSQWDTSLLFDLNFKNNAEH